jgi:hypothetical protein
MMSLAFLSRMLASAVLCCGGVLHSHAQPVSPVPEPARRSALPAASMSGVELLAELREGGYVIFFGTRRPIYRATIPARKATTIAATSGR